MGFEGGWLTLWPSPWAPSCARSMEGGHGSAYWASKRWRCKGERWRGLARICQCWAMIAKVLVRAVLSGVGAVGASIMEASMRRTACFAS